jgi:predicted nucleotidyltransferase
MLSNRDKQIVHAFKRRLEEFVNIVDLRVFGSRARGDNDPDSDLDIFIVVEDLTPDLRRSISEIAWEIGFEHDQVISTTVTTSYNLEHGAMGANPLIFSIDREGIPV